MGEGTASPGSTKRASPERRVTLFDNAGIEQEREGERELAGDGAVMDEKA